jgi:hypothetical protein
MAPEYGKIDATEKNLNRCYSQGPLGEKRNKYVIAFRKLFETLEFGGGQERRVPEQGPVGEASQQLPGKEILQVRRCEEKRPRTGPNPLQPTQNDKSWNLNARCNINKKEKESSDESTKNTATRCLSESICLR